MTPRSSAASASTDALEWPTLPGKRLRSGAPERRPARSSRYEENYPGQHEELLRIFGELVGEHGYDGTQISAVVARAGVSRRTFYEHFENKEQALAELLQQSGKTVVELFIEVADREVEHGAYATFLGIITAWGRIKADGQASFLSPRVLSDLWSAARKSDSQLAKTLDIVVTTVTRIFVVAAKRLDSPFDDEFLASTARQQIMGLVGAIEPATTDTPKPTHEALARGLCASFGLPFPAPEPKR